MIFTLTKKWGFEKDFFFTALEKKIIYLPQVFLFYDFEFKAVCDMMKPKSKNLTEVGNTIRIYWNNVLSSYQLVSFSRFVFHISHTMSHFQGSVSSCINNWYNKDPIERQQQAADE